MSHVLRHSFASHFMMAGGNILVLQRFRGHSDIRISMRTSRLIIWKMRFTAIPCRLWLAKVAKNWRRKL
ncbi:tyrosine-type recombinase/integrase [Pantoea sp. EABMAA-21]|uniref:tyrosine-type recombinase/integrase n=1 Tax=Pantoea sp. EABMAA-21 TaxID=3043302 RepID=UPI0024B56082|nr:tyrosine-type recombinase/integrase [Pantoea sp. EABMAA-21]MDI9276039.1 tyrosine-type recombinase/integrase [Pantoea sp. EABMAA-21]